MSTPDSRGADGHRASVELIRPGEVEPDGRHARRGGGGSAPLSSRGRAAAVLALVAAAVLFVQLAGTDNELGDGQPTDPPTQVDESGASLGPELDSPNRLDALVTAGSLPSELVAAEVYQAAPGPDTLRALLRSVGGLDAVTVATAEGSFDLVTFSPRDRDRLAASRRSGYGPAENQDVNEAWQITANGEVLSSRLSLTTAHDFAHFNNDGSMSYWWNPGDAGAGSRDYAPRSVTLGPLPRLGDHHSDPLHPSRAVVVDGTLFALTGNPDYYSNSRVFESLIADRGDGQVVLDDGAGWSWVDSPTPGIVVTYPVADDGATAVWSTDTLSQVEDHILADRPYQRASVSGDGSTVVGITFGGALWAVDTETGRTTSRFGQVDPRGIVTPITLNHDGTIAVTVDHNGTVTIWWVGEPEPIAVIEGDAGPLRVLSEYRAPRVSSSVAPGAVRVAVRNAARPGSATTWSIVDTDPARWVDLACRLAGRSLTAGERAELGLGATPPACA